jgi:hypothetical protein
MIGGDHLSEREGKRAAVLLLGLDAGLLAGLSSRVGPDGVVLLFSVLILFLFSVSCFVV